jgi:release factor glutamine methyltransferase
VDLDRGSIARALATAGCVAPDDEASELVTAAAGDQARLAAMVARRSRGEPLAWLTGRTTFCGIVLEVAHGTYVPRTQSEPLARHAAALLPAAGTAVDLCTGVGTIAAVLIAADRSARVLATEIDEVTASCARRNGVDVHVGFLDDPLPAGLERAVDVITAVVPYVPSEELHLLPRDVVAYEPQQALDGGTGGTVLLSEVARRSTRLLRTGGHLLLELGGDQPERLGPELRGNGFTDVEVMRDEEGDPRAIFARLAQRSGRAGPLRPRIP